MKRLFSTFTALAIGLSAFADTTQMLMQIARKKANAGGAAYDFVETFEGSEVDSQSQIGYDNAGWEAGTATADINPRYATAPAPLAGSYSIQIVGAGLTRYIEWTFATAKSSFFFYFKINPVGYDSFAKQIFQLYDASDNLIGRLMSRTGYDELYTYHGTVNDLTAQNHFYEDTTYEVWGEWQSESSDGNLDGVLRIKTSSDGTKPASWTREITVGDSEAAVKYFRIEGATESIFDNFIIHSTDIPENPL